MSALLLYTNSLRKMGFYVIFASFSDIEKILGENSGSPEKQANRQLCASLATLHSRLRLGRQTAINRFARCTSLS